MIRRRARDGAVRFEVEYKRTGRRFYVGSYPTEREAREAEQDFAATRRRIERGELPELVDVRRTFRAASEEWLEALERRKSRSTEIYRKRLRLYLWREFGNVALTDLAKQMIIAFRDRMARKLAPATVNSLLICLSGSFTHFAERQWIDKNPCRGVKPVPDPESDYRWIHTREEMTRLLTACAGDLRPIVALTLATGLRLDEVLHLEWSDVDLTARLLTVHRGRQGTTKSGKMRRVPILDSVLPMLREMALKRGGDRLVFPSPRGKGKGGPRTKPGVWEIYKLALKRAGLDPELRFHDLRHTFASHWVMDGGDIFKLSRILGHSDVKMTLRYAHLAPTAFEPDYGRLAFMLPTERAVVRLPVRGANGRLIGTASVIPAESQDPGRTAGGNR